MMIRLMIPLMDFENKKSSTDQVGMSMFACYQIVGVMTILVYNI